MFTEVVSFKKQDNPEDRKVSKKMILVAKDYVQLLQKKKERSGKNGKTEMPSDPVKVDGVFVATPTLGQLLASLSDDLRCATSIFLEEFIVCGGVECLLDVLKASLNQQTQHTLPATPRQQQTAIRKSLAEQYDCLMCLKFAMKNPKALKRLMGNSNGISTIASCIMTSSAKIRIVSLELLCQVADCSIDHGHTLILDSLTANRVLFGEPVRFKFLVGMLHGPVVERPIFQTVGLKLLNTILRTSPKPSERIRLQCELEEAGFNIATLEATVKSKSVSPNDAIWEEIATWKKSYLDMESVTGQKKKVEYENEKLQKEVQLLRRALQKLEEDKINLMQIEMELKEKCDDLNEEVSTLKTEIKQTKTLEKKITNSVPAFTKEINFRRFGDDDDDIFLSSGDSGQLETEEIFIDVPTIRPPIEFCTDTDSLKRNSKPTIIKDTSKVLDKSLFQYQTDQSLSTGIGSKTTTTSNNSASDKESADSALSESESDSGINWNYPDITETSNLSRSSRSRNRFAEDNDIGTNFYRCGANKALRSKSEDRRDTFDSIRTQTLDGETKVVESNGFFMMRRPDIETVARQSSLPTRDVPLLSRFQQSISINSPVTPSYQLPVAYRSNFLVRGHSNCDLYSGISPTTNPSTPSPPIPPPDYTKGYSVANSGGTISALVHREITKAVRQISGWI